MVSDTAMVVSIRATTDGVVTDMFRATESHLGVSHLELSLTAIARRLSLGLLEPTTWPRPTMSHPLIM